MKVTLVHWLKNLPWKLAEVLICDLFGHKPASDLEFIPGLTICERCMAPLKQDREGGWYGNFAINDIKQPNYPILVKTNTHLNYALKLEQMYFTKLQQKVGDEKK